MGARVGGWLAVGVSVALLGVVLVRDVGLNVLNGWTIVLAAAGGLIAITRDGRAARLTAFALVLLAALPALVGGFALLYIPSLVLIFPLHLEGVGRERGITNA
ncbi:MAG: hypothetical protein H0V49_01110 [Nocardioidaceae bacterium]|nr:hypothetical protein [Nocardioidaceae bacterium]